MNGSINQKFNTKSLLMFTLPSIVMMVFCSIYSMSGGILVSKNVSELAMSGMTIVNPVATVVIAMAIMFATGANAIISKNLGEGNIQKARENFTNIFIIGTVLGMIFSVGVLLFDDEIISFFGATADLAVYSKPYLRTFACIFPFVFWEIYSQFFYVTIGKPMLGMIFIILGGIFNLALNYLLIAKLGFGVVGAAIGVSAGFVVPGLIFLFYFAFNRKAVLHFVKPKYHKGFVSNTCLNGSSELVINVASAIVTVTINIIMLNLIGEDGVIAASVFLQMQFLLNSTFIGFGAGVAPIFGFAYGSKNHEQTKNVFAISLRFVVGISIFIFLMCLLGADFMVGLFVSPDSHIFPLAKQAFSIFAVGYLFAGTSIFASTFFTAMSNGKMSALISFLRTFVFILGMLAILPPMFDELGVWLAIPVAEFLGCMVAIFILMRNRSRYHY